MQEFSAADAVVKINGPDALAGAVEALLQSKLRRVPLVGLVEMQASVADDRAGAVQPIRVWQVGAD